MTAVEEWATEKRRSPGRAKFVRWYCAECGRLGPAIAIDATACRSTAALGGKYHCQRMHPESP